MSNKIGNILYTDELVNHKKVDYINYIENDNINIINNDLPTLIVGWYNVKKNNLKNISILNKTITPYNLYWEFTFEENKSNHVDGVETFTKLLPNYYFQKRYNYYTIDPIFYDIYVTEDIIKHINGEIEKCYLNNDMLYILTNENNIYGLNLHIYNYFLIKKENLLFYFSNKINIFVEDENNEIFNKYLNFFNGFEYTKRYLITFL